ncbi:MAG: type II toxin-antitoxin system MqsA family antitoxin [Pseudomonadota bacterium]
MRCPICSAGTVRASTVALPFHGGITSLVIEGVPANVCESCGRMFLDPETADKAVLAADNASENERDGHLVAFDT